jgi:hypothetical protein
MSQCLPKTEETIKLLQWMKKPDVSYYSRLSMERVFSNSLLLTLKDPH